MSEPTESSAAAAPAASPPPTSLSTAKQELLARQRALELELNQARQSARFAKRQAAEKSEEAPEEEEAEGWLLTYLDTMTLMLVLLVVMLSFAGKGRHDQAESAGRGIMPAGDGLLPGGAGLIDRQTQAKPVPPEEAPANPNAQDPLAGLPLDKLGKDIEVVVQKGTVSFRISSEILFDSARSDLSLDGLKVLQQLIPVFNSSQHNVVVVGHTDSVPISSARFPSNWELSSARAGSVVRYLQANGVDGRRLRAVGYADTQPLADNATAEGRARNRRVELVLEAPR
ncbi:flagellar motor protein MotB [Azotobacter bryophylli]|uniref:Flagellar motor protein MotB n=1 Tax=Azotobacter bryophylli TaxID=1986537 RepID=A0ABV7ATB0_9GAMM